MGAAGRRGLLTTGGTASIDPRDGKTNLLPSIIITDASWTAASCTRALVAGGGPDGTDAYSVLSNNGFFYTLSNPIVASNQYTFGAFVRVPSGFSCVCTAAMLYNGGSSYHTNGLFSPFVNNQAEWILVEQTFTALNTQLYVFIGLSSFEAGEKLEIWKPMVYAGAKVS